MASSALKIYGMDCAEEIATLKRELIPIPGVQDLSFDLLNARMVVNYDGSLITDKKLIEVVNGTGMRAEPFEDSKSNEENSTRWQRWGRTYMTSLSALFLVTGFVTHSFYVGTGEALGGESQDVPTLARALYLMSAVTGAWFVLPKALFAIKRLRPDMNLLMMVAVIGAIIIGEWFEAATVSFLFAVSLALESWSVSRARKAVAALMELSPPKARVIGANGKEELVDVSTVKLGTKVIIKPGDKIPLDGRIVSGTSAVNQAPITGESMPVEKKVGDEVFAGTINEDGAIEIETVKISSESTLSKIIKLVEEVQSKRSPSEQWVEKFARIYTPSVMALALLVAVLPPLFGGSWSVWFYEALVLLVIACPCALVISTPVSIVAALTAAARNGILIKGGVYVEVPARLKAVALDKTGTLTEGHPAVEKLVPLSGHSEDELLQIAAAIELRSEHPLARAIVKHATNKGINPKPVENYQAVKGKGATALLGGRPVWLGSHRYLEERGTETPEMHSTLEELSAGGKSVVVIGEADHVCGFITLADKVRSTSQRAVKEMKASGLHVVMLTGDNEPTARAIGALSGVDEIRAELLPEDKLSAIEELVRKHGTVAMIGDGVNDAPALARSSLGIAMGAIGTDAALETADIAFMKDELLALPWLITHSRRTLRVIHQNIAASLGIKVIFMILVFSGYGSLWAAIAADMGVSLGVVSNALRLLRSTN